MKGTGTAMGSGKIVIGKGDWVVKRGGGIVICKGAVGMRGRTVPWNPSPHTTACYSKAGSVDEINYE